MNNEKLIGLVQGYSFLYDLDDRRYCDNQKKADAWKEISKKLRVDENYCKRSWSLLRDSFRRAIKKQKKPNGAFRRKYKYQDEMTFLLPYLKERPNTLCNVPDNNKDKESDDERNSSDEDSLTSDDVKLARKSQLPSEQTNACTATVTQPSVSKTKRLISGTSHHTPVLKRKKIMQNISRETLSTRLMKFILQNKTKSNDIQQFFDSISTTVQSFPPQDRAVAKAKVFAVISQMELDILSRNGITETNSTNEFEWEDVKLPMHLCSEPIT